MKKKKNESLHILVRDFSGKIFIKKNAVDVAVTLANISFR